MNLRKLAILASTALCLAMPPKPVEAAPLAAVIGGLVGGLGTIGTALLGTALSIGANWLIQKIFTEEPKPQGVKQRLESGGDNPISFMVGYYSTPGKLVWVNTYEDDNEGLLMVINLSEVPVDSLSSKVVINGQICDINFGDLDSGGFAKVDQYQKSGTNYCSMKFYNDPNSAPNYLVNEFSGDPLKPWTNDMVGEGCSYVVVYCQFSEDGGIWGGVPQFKFVTKGIPLYDPRKDDTVGGSGPHRWGQRNTYEWSENCAVVNYNILRGISYDGKKVYGGNATAAQMPLDSWIPAMNTCDENVPLAAGGTVKRYTMGAEISVDIAPLDIVREIDNSCSGHTFEFGGVWKMFVGAPNASVVTITDEDVIVSSEQTDDLFKPLQETFNVAQGSYPEPKACWEQKDAPTIYFDEYIEEDGEELSVNMEFPYVYEKNQVQRLMRAAVKESRRERVHTLELPPSFAIFEPYDVFTWNSTRNGYVAKKFLVLQKDDLPNVNQVFVLRELDEDDYEWDVLYELESEVASLDDPPLSPTSRDFDVFPDQVDSATPGGQDRPAIRAVWNWNAVDLNVKRIEWEARRAGTTKLSGFGDFDNYEDGERIFTHESFRFNTSMQVRFRIIPISNFIPVAWTNWKAITFDVFAVPTAPTLTAKFDTAEDGTNVHYLFITWTPVTAQTSTYQINLNDGTDDRVYNASVSPAKIPVTSGKTYTVKVAAVDAVGTVGGYSPTTALLVPKKAVAPTTPAGLTVTAGHRRNALLWTESPDKDYKRTDIYRSTTNDFTTAVIVGSTHGRKFADVDLALNTTYYYWIIHVDRSNNLSAKFPVSNTAGVSGATTYIADPDTDPTAPAAPGGLTLTQVARDVDGDGKIDISFKAAWSAVAGAKSYEVEVTQGSDVWYMTAKNRSVLIKAKAGFLYSVKVMSITFNQTGSVFSSAVTLTPVNKSALAVAPTTLTVAGGTRRNKVKWSASNEKDYKHTLIYRSPDATWASAVLVEKIDGTVFIDDDLVTGTGYRYYVAHQDTSGNISTVFPSNAGAGVLGTPGTISSADIPDNSIADVKLTGQLSFQRVPVDYDVTNMFKNPSFKGGTMQGWVNSSGWTTMTRAACPIAGAPAAYVAVATPNGNYQQIYSGVNGGATDFFEVSPLETYAGRYFAAASALATNGNTKMTARFANASGDGIYSYQSITQTTLASLGLSGLWTEIKGLTIAPATVNGLPTAYMSVYIEIDNVATTGVVYITKARVRRATDNDMLGAGAVSDSKTDQTAPGVPTGLTLTQTARDLDGDGRVDIAFRLTWTAPVGGVVVRHYVVEVNDGTDTYHFETKKSSFRVNAIVGKTYTCKVSAVSFNGIESTQTAGVGLTPVKLSTAPGAVAGLSIVAKFKGFRLFWTEVTDKDFAFTRVWRYPTALDATNDTNATYVGSTKGNAFVDQDALANNTAYWYRVAHVNNSQNQNTKSSAVTGTTAYVLDADADQTAPNVPTALNLVQMAKDVDGDGRVDISVKATWTAPAAGVPVRYYVLEVADGADTFYYQTKKSSFKFPGVVGRTYTAKVSSVSFAGIEGTQTGGVALAPGKKSVAPAAASGLVVTPRANLMDLVWARCADLDYKETIITRGGVEIARIKGNSYEDTALLVKGTSYTYTVQHVDNSLNVGTVSSGVAGIFRGIGQGDSNMTDANSYVENSDLSLGANIGWSDPSTIVADGVNAYKGPNVMRRAYTGAASNYVNRNKALFSVRTGEQYLVGGMMKTDGSFATSAGYAGYRMSFTDINGTEVATAAAFMLTAVNTTWTEYQTAFTVPATAGIVYGRIEPVVIGQTAGTIYWSSMYARPVVTDSMTLKTLPGVAGTPSLSSLAADLDLDGTLDPNITATWTAPASSVAVPPAVDFEVEISNCSTIGGTYVVRDVRIVAGLSVTFKANAAKFYKVRVRARSFSGATGANWSALSTGLQPVNYSSSVQAGGTPTVTIKGNGFYLTWARCNDKNWKETIVLRGGVEIGRSKTNAFFDGSTLTVGNSYTYTIQHVNNADQVGTVSTGVAVTYRQVNAAELGPAAILPANYYRNPAGNLILDYELLDRTKWTFREYALGALESTAVTIPDVNVTHALNASDSGYGGSDYTFTVQNTGSGPKNILIESDKLTPVQAGERYKVGVYVNQINGSATAFFAAVRLHILYWKSDASGNLIFLQSNSLKGRGYTSVLFDNIYYMVASHVAPAGATFATLRVHAEPTAGQTVQPAVRIGSPFIKALPKASDLVLPLYNNSGSSTSFGSGASGVALNTIDLDPATNANLDKADLSFIAEVVFSFTARHLSGAAKDIRFEINETNAGVFSFNYYNSGVCNFRDQELISFTVAAEIGSLFFTDYAFEVRAYGSAAGNTLGASRMTAQVYMSND